MQTMTSRDNLLVELLVEELPPKALDALGEAFGLQLAQSLFSQGLIVDASAYTTFASPRRLAVHVRDVASLATAGSAALASAGDTPAIASTSESAVQTATATTTAIAEAAVASTAASAAVTAGPDQVKALPVVSETPTPVVQPWYMQMRAWIVGG